MACSPAAHEAQKIKNRCFPYEIGEPADWRRQLVDERLHRPDQLRKFLEHWPHHLIDSLTDVDRDVVEGDDWRAGKRVRIGGQRALAIELPVHRQSRRDRWERGAGHDRQVELEVDVGGERWREDRLDVRHRSRHLGKRESVVFRAAWILEIDGECPADEGALLCRGIDAILQADLQRAELAFQSDIGKRHIEGELEFVVLSRKGQIGLEVDALRLADPDAKIEVEAELRIDLACRVERQARKGEVELVERNRQRAQRLAQPHHEDDIIGLAVRRLVAVGPRLAVHRHPDVCLATGGRAVCCSKPAEVRRIEGLEQTVSNSRDVG